MPYLSKGDTKRENAKSETGASSKDRRSISRVAIDFVGPLPITEKKNRYILVCMDYATRFPEAFPMKNQDAESVANALIEMFSRVGFSLRNFIRSGDKFYVISHIRTVQNAEGQ